MNHTIESKPEDLGALKDFYDRFIDAEGRWSRPNRWAEHAMKGYSLLYLSALTKDTRYHKAAESLNSLVTQQLPRTTDGCIAYRPDLTEVLVDTLAMICPFLARYSRLNRDQADLDLGINQLVQFIRHNVDLDTHLPYHGYYPGGPRQLGLHGWGRGTGWYLIGLVDTLLELPKDHPEFEFLLEAYKLAIDSLIQYQRIDGLWSWAVLQKYDSPDSSAACMICYSITRGILGGLLETSYRTITETTARRLVNLTLADGLIDRSSGECDGLGKYPQAFSPSPWLQGAGAAFLTLHINNLAYL